MPDIGAIGTRWLGVGLTAVLAVATISLAVTGRLGLYINPDSSWFAVSMAVLALVGAVLSFLLPLGAESEHGHDHGEGSAGLATRAPRPPGPVVEPAQRDGTRRAHGHHGSTSGLGTVATVAGGGIASVVVVAILVLPPASLSAEIAVSRDVGSAPLFAGADVVNLASTGDTTRFGVGDWASVFATATNTDAFEGDTVTLTGFATPASAGEGFRLTRLVITHCVIDAQTASIPVALSADSPGTGDWVTVTGTVRSTSDGTLEIDASDVTATAEPQDPYEY